MCKQSTIIARQLQKEQLPSINRTVVMRRSLLQSEDIVRDRSEFEADLRRLDSKLLRTTEKILDACNDLAILGRDGSGASLMEIVEMKANKNATVQLAFRIKEERPQEFEQFCLAVAGVAAKSEPKNFAAEVSAIRMLFEFSSSVQAQIAEVVRAVAKIA